eukprot:scaffold152662_cov17-Tisochrysis_lutea.AAC.1
MFPYPGHNGVPCIKGGVAVHILTMHLASGMSLAKSWSQIGFWMFKCQWTLAAVLHTAIVGRFQ